MSRKIVSVPKVLGTALLGAVVVGIVSCASVPAKKTESPELRKRTLINSDWRFHSGDVLASNEVISVSYDDSRWQRVEVPHDYGLDGKYDLTNSRRRGYLPIDVAWYRKSFSIPQTDKGKVLQLEFGGIFRDSRIWLNGHFLKRHQSGYIGFFCDISKVANYGGENVIVVQVDPREREGWWYEGGGIYRNVYYSATAPLHVANYGTYVVSKVPNGDQGAAEEAELTIETTVENSNAGGANCNVVSEILAPDGKVVATVKAEGTVNANDQKPIVQKTVIQRPKLWSLETPNLYELRTTILQDGCTVDSTKTTFGIRTIRFDADKGFFLNGKHIKIFGVANHQDMPAVGIAVPDSLQPWRVNKLKEMGCNAWRMAHNPPNESLLDACDRMGMLVKAENRHLGDTYSNSPPGTAYSDLSDLADMIKRDRNHPSIIMWSMCNEEKLQGTEEGATIFTAMRNVVHRYDKTRPVTSAMNGGWLQKGFADVEDLIGVNYHPNSYDEIHKAHPKTPIFGSETANTKTTRGAYKNDKVNGWASSYNLIDDGLPKEYSPGICSEGWPNVASREFVAGSFTWTGFDYKGEPNPFGWPDISNNTGLMDVCGFPKDKYYYMQSCWSDKPMVHLMPMNWNWPGKEGKNMRVVVFSNGRQVELFLNGKSLGKKDTKKDSYLKWDVTYEPGQLMAKAYVDGKLTATDIVETTDKPAQLELSPDRKTLTANGNDTLIVPVAILDGKGRIVPDASNRVRFELVGGGKILGVGNGNPSDHDPDRANQRNAFNGRCMVMIQGGERRESLQLTASSPGLKSATVTLESK